MRSRGTQPMCQSPGPCGWSEILLYPAGDQWVGWPWLALVLLGIDCWNCHGTKTANDCELFLVRTGAARSAGAAFTAAE